MTIDDLFVKASQHGRVGDLGEAVVAYRDILRLQPDHRDALYFLALTKSRQNELHEGHALLERLLALDPTHLGAHRDLGLVRQRLGRDADALVSFDRALKLEPKHVATLRNRAQSLRRLNRFAEALRDYDEGLSITPVQIETLSDRGTLLHQLEHLDEALASFDRALAIDPHHVDALVNRAMTLKGLGRFGEALASYDQALAIDPNHADALNNRGNLLLVEFKQFEQALVNYDRALAINPNHSGAWMNRAGALRELDRLNEARVSCDRALAIQPNSVSFLLNRGTLFLDLRQFEEALVDLEKAFAIEPEHPYTFCEIADAALRICDWPRIGRYAAGLKKHVVDETSIIYPLSLIRYFDEPPLQLTCARNYLRDKIRTLPSPMREGRSRRRGKARIAYLSSDFRNHPVSYLAAELFEHHDRSRFEVFGISFGVDDGGEMRARIIRAFDHFHDVRGYDDHKVAKLLNELEIDIAVDLNGHTKNQRFGIFAHRPASIQVSYLGFPGTTGADFIDYVIADEIVLPFDQQPFWSEKIVHLPDCFQVNDRKRQIAERTPTRKECGLPERGFVFCCFNNNYKISPAFFDIWMRLLDKVEGSVLWLVRDGAPAERNLRREAAARGIDPARLVFADRLPLAEHLARYRLADLFLDTLPYNAGTTASDALWVGLPVLTCLGKSFAARMAASLNHSVGLPELVTKSLEEYETLARRLAREPALLHAYRERLEKNRLTAPLFDTDRFRRHLEQAYTTMIEFERQGEAPRSFSVQPVRLDSRGQRSGPNGLQNLMIARDPFEEAVRNHREGHLDEAVRRYQEVLKNQPAHRDALYGFSLVRFQQNEFSESQALVEKLLAIAPTHAGAHRTLGVLHAHFGRDDEALGSFDRSLAIEPGNVANWRNRATLLFRANRLVEALESFDRAFAIAPDHAETLGDRGAVLHQLQRFDEALASFEQSLAIVPRRAQTLYNRAITLRKLKRLEDALASCDQALAVEPTHVDALDHRGSVLTELKRFEEALASYDRALALNPEHARAWINRARALRWLKRTNEALASYDRALAIQPESTTYFSRGTILFNLARFEEAADSFEKGWAIDPEHPQASWAAAFAAAKVCDWQRREKFIAVLRSELTDAKKIIDPFSIIGFFDDPALQLQCARAFLKHKIENLPAPIGKPKARRHRKPRIAYLSADFREHPVSYLIAELFERHDRSRFEVFGISFGADDKSEMRARLVKAFDHFHDVRDRDDRQVAELLGELEIDVAVDLNGFTRDDRFGIFAHRPAPIQVSYLGYLGTTGADFIDYVIGDEIVLPFDQQPFWSEKIVHLPGSYQVNDSKRQIAGRTPTRQECGLPEQGFVFCSLNNSYKITPPFFEIWMRLLHKVEGSVLWLVRGNAAVERNLRREAAARGIDPARLVFADPLPLAEYLARYRVADLFLDTLPYNAGATGSDALWAGLPVLTCLGKTFTGRMAASLNHAVCLPELVTHSLEDYETLALKLASEPLLLASYRERLEKNRLTAPLFDTDRFRRHLEQAYTTMLDIHRRGEPPRGFSVVSM